MRHNQKIGQFLVSKGAITENEMRSILDYSKESGERFCKAGLQLKLLTQEKLIQAFVPGYEGEFFNLDVSHLKKTDSQLIEIAEMVRYGILPLGLKKEKNFLRQSRRSHLVIGMLDPSRFDSVMEACQRKIKNDRRIENFSNARIYLILVDQFLDVLEKFYGVSENDVRKYHLDEICPILRDFLNVSSGATQSKIPRAA
jgi:hypothetical protein